MFILSCLLFLGVPKITRASSVQLEIFSADSANVNSFIFFNSYEATVVDATRTSKDALEIAKIVRAHGANLTKIFVTHGHPDHYIGLGALKKEFPKAQIFVANQEIKDDIAGFARTAEHEHWLSDEPLMYPKSDRNPSGFDYESEIHILTSDALELPGGENLQVSTKFPPTEAHHETVLYSKTLNSLFVSDLVYNHVHLWLAGGIDLQSIKNWQTELKNLKNKYAHLPIKIYPGHGSPTDSRIFDIDLKYIETILSTVRASKSQEDAKSSMMSEYPDWKNTDFILIQSLKNLFQLLKNQKRGE